MKNRVLSRGQNAIFLGYRTWSAVKGCHIKIKSVMSEDHNLGEQTRQQAAGNFKTILAQILL